MRALFFVLPLNQQLFASAESEMGVFNRLPCGLDEVDVIIAGGEYQSLDVTAQRSIEANELGHDRCDT